MYNLPPNNVSLRQKGVFMTLKKKAFYTLKLFFKISPHSLWWIAQFYVKCLLKKSYLYLWQPSMYSTLNTLKATAIYFKDWNIFFITQILQTKNYNLLLKCYSVAYLLHALLLLSFL